MRNHILIICIQFISLFAYSQAPNISDIDKPAYEAYTIERIDKMGKVLSKVAKKKNDEDVKLWGLEILDSMFYEARSTIFHQFPEHTTTRPYTNKGLIENFSRFQVVVLDWIQIYRDSLKLPLPICQDPQCRVKVYKDRTMGFKEYFLAGGSDASSMYERVFPKTVTFRFYNIDDEVWYMKIDRITSLIGEPPNPNDDYDGDGIINKNDDCPTIKGVPENNGCPPSDIDGDGIMDRKDQCPDVFGEPRCNGCPCKKQDDGPTVNKVNLIKPGLKPFIPAYGDYKLRPKKSGAHWLWAAGIGASLGASGYNYFKCDERFPGCRLPAAYYETDFERYREAKLHRQNAIIFGVMAGAIYITDIVDTYLAVGRINNRAIKSGNFQIGLSVEPIGLHSVGINTGIRLNLSGKPATPDLSQFNHLR